LHDVTENRRLIDELSTANRRLEEYNRLKAEFVANMSHELRTPLNAILGFAQILQIKSPTEPLVGSQNSSVERILRNGRHLLRLIDDVLDLSKIEAGRINFHPDHFDLVKLVEGAFSELESLAHNKKLAYKLSVTGKFPLAYLDSVRVKQIITNLLSNAIKFTASGSVTAELKLIDNEKWMLAMHDTGAGIKPEALKLIFERFRQIDGTTTRTVGGVGLGLSIAQQMAYMLGGQILVESEEGVGSTFTLILPFRMPNELRFEVIHAENSEKSEFSRLSKNADDKDTRPLILAIDDNADSRSLLTETLTRAGYRVETAIDGATGLRLAKELLPTAVVLDIMMPQVDGWQVLQTMKGDTHTSGIPVIVCSIVDNRPLGYQLGASDYLVKPVEPHQLIETLRTVATHSATDDHANNYILVVDDEYGVREMLVAALKQEGYQVRSAASGEIAFNIAVQKTPSVVLCDLIMLGGMSGFELIARLRTNPSTAKTPIIVITGREVTPEDRRLMSGQIADVIRKGDLLMPNVEVRLREVLDDLGIIP
jgi:CheY-like chemotaxis protein